ncbi:MAG: hypothetical protein JKX76_03595 [Colwellia sp.]|nr:hypothetical protein [Colwellia sp.]
MILRPEFRNEAQLNESNATIENILITIGGSDFRQILPSIIESCLAAEIANIKVIAPTDAGKFQQDSRITVLPLRNAASMYTLMLEADVVISACGQTLHELSVIGRPIVGICLDIDQRPNQEYYLKEEVLQLDIKWDDADLKEKTRKNIDMLQSQEVRHSIIQKAQSLVNKDGVNIFVKYVKEISK